ncbi:MAG: SURF1 family protein, partial [Gemmatimonadota bacterium]
VRWRRVRLRGRYDPDREIVLRARSRNGTPGVETLTPLRIGAGDEAPAVLVLRGWLPAPDGLRGDLASGWPAGTEAAPPRTVTVEGIAVEASPPGDARPLRLLYEGTEHLVLVTADPTAAREALPYPVASFYVRATDPGPAGPALRPPRPLDTSAGPHLSYAIQWFSFAVIALVGTALYVRKESAR